MAVKKGKMRRGEKILSHCLLLLGGTVLLYPLVFMFMAAFYSKEEYYTSVLGILPMPEMPTMDNFMNLFKDSDMRLWFSNSVGRTIYSVVCTVITTFLGGYAFGRLKFKGKDTLFFILLATQMIPPTVNLIPNYIQFARWPFAGGNDIFFGGRGILDSYWVYLVYGPALNIMGTFIVKQYMESIPMEYDESAKIDGAGTFSIIFRILFPMSKPIFAYIAITTAISTWNDWQTPFFFTSSTKYNTLPSAIARLTVIATGGITIPDYPYILTLALGLTIPALVIYFVFQRYIVEGLASYGIKG